MMTDYLRDGDSAELSEVSIELEHNYRTCRGEDCDRIVCRVYKEGRAATTLASSQAS
jgi:hypothetical protein